MPSQGAAAVLIRTIQGVLVVGALALCIRASTELVLWDGAPPTSALKDLQPLPRASMDADRFGLIAERDLFHREVEAVVEPAPPPVVESTLEVELVGTLVRGSDEPPEIQGNEGTFSNVREVRPESLAILRDVDGKVRTLAKGEVFADDRAKLVEIGRGRIVLDHEGRLETVSLEESALAAKVGPPRPTYGGPRDPVALAAAAKAEEIARMQREVQRRMREAMPQVGATPPVTVKN